MSAVSNEAPPTATRLVPIAPAVQGKDARQKDDQEAEVMPYTCVACARRKVKCDKTIPCSACRKGRLDCTYQAPAPRKRKRRPVEDIHERLERYERVLKENNLLPDRDEYEHSPGEHDGPQKSNDLLTPGPTTEPITHRRTGKLLSGQGKTRYIDSNIWTNLSEEIHPSSDEEDAADYPLSQVPYDPVSAAFFSTSPPAKTLADLHPPYDMALKLFDIYARDIDPIIKVVHVPTTLKLIKQVAANPENMTKVTECLVFAIYHFAIVTLNEQECEQTFGQPWGHLQSKYHRAAQDALMSCSFLRTTELPVLQAFMLILMSMKSQYDPHTFWILTGVAVRLAQRMGLHRDGEELGLKPFDVQLRRRIFWQLIPLDGLASKLSGTGIAISSNSWDTKQPLNINDDEIWPDMTETPEEKKQATDMIFCLARTEIGKFHKKLVHCLGGWSSVWEVNDFSTIEKSLSELENLMEEKYIRYCDISTPIHCLTMAMARSALGAARLQIRLPRTRSDKATIEDRKETFALAKKILELTISVHRNSNLSRFHWHLRQFFQWDPLIWVLNELRRPEPILEPELGWRLIGEVFTSQPMMLSRGRSLDTAVARLTLKSWDHTQSTQRTPLQEPAFVVDLKEFFARREASKHSNDTSPQSMYTSTTGDHPNDFNLQAYYLPNNNNNNNNNAGFMNMNMNEFTDMDWMFWEQLLPNATSYVPTLP